MVDWVDNVEWLIQWDDVNNLILKTLEINLQFGIAGI
jgi:hypothetical protein